MAKKKTIHVSVQFERNGPWERISIEINPQDFLDAKSKDLFIRQKAEMFSIGNPIISVDYNYNETQALKDTKDQ